MLTSYSGDRDLVDGPVDDTNAGLTGNDSRATSGEAQSFSEGLTPVTHYIALVHKDADTDYGVSFPDLPGCVTAGATLDEARAMAAAALALHLEGLAEDGEAIPAPSSLEAIMVEAEHRDAIAAFAVNAG